MNSRNKVQLYYLSFCLLNWELDNGINQSKRGGRKYFQARLRKLFSYLRRRLRGAGLSIKSISINFVISRPKRDGERGYRTLHDAQVFLIKEKELI